MSAFHEQVDGSHYTTQVIQPFELAYLVADGDAGFCKLVKYLTREKGERKVNLEKAKHIVQLTQEIFTTHSRSFPTLTPQNVKILQTATGTLDTTNLDIESPQGILLALYAGFLANEFEGCIEIIDALIGEEEDGS